MNRLYERSAEIAAIDRAVAELGDGRGSAVLVEARAGRGKSTLVEYAVTAAREAGARTLLARARHLESAAPFEVLRRLLGPAVEESGGATALTGAAGFAAPLFTPGAELAAGVDYGCQWLIAGIAEQAPLVLAVDDAHWADAASLRVLLEVLAEISVQPILLFLASRPVENPDAQRRLVTMAAEPECLLLSPALLSREGVRAVVTETLGESVADVFVDDCLKVSGGNAFYLRELLRPYQSDFRPDLQSVVEDGSMSLQRTLSWRLSELGTEACALAQAAAILGDGCSLHDASELAEVDPALAVAEAARLEAASVFGHGDPVDFVHPLVRGGVEETLTTVEVGDLHARAARLLWANGAPQSIVVQHLVASPGSGDSQVAKFLTEKGLAALETGSVAVAVRLLRRALDEQAAQDDREHLLVRLAEAEHSDGDLDAARTHLETVLAGDDRDNRLLAAAELFDVLVDSDQFADVVRLHKEVVSLRPYGDSVAEVRLKTQLLANVVMDIDPDLRELPRELRDFDTETLEVDRGVDRYFLVWASIGERTLARGDTRAFTANLARVVASLPSRAGDLTFWDVWSALTAAPFLADDELDEAEALLRRVAPAVARLRGTSVAMQPELDLRLSQNMMHRGNFEDALSEIEASAEFTARHHLDRFTGMQRFIRGWVAFERGDYDTAGDLLGERLGDENVFPALGALLAGRVQDAVDALDSFGFPVDPDAATRPIEVELEPHLIASHAFEAADDRDRAIAEAERELAIRREYGPPFRLAQALRRQASFLPARQAVGVLEEAVALAESTPRRPVQVRVLTSYGAALRRSGDSEGARAALYRAADGAAEMGMTRVVERARAELAEAGGRPRRARRTGPTSLTHAQEEVAALAVKGFSNREIAEQLYVTIKTVETHLAAVYRKLGVRGRNDLESSLGVQESAAHAMAEH